MTDTNGLGEPIKPPSLYAKLAEVMGECGYVKKNGWNSHFKYSYVTEADLVDAVREKLAARNVALIPAVRSVTREGKLSTVEVSFTFCDGDSGETHTADWAGTGEDPGDKGLYKAYTGAVKYFLMKSFLIPTGDDPEADAGTDERSAGGQSSAPRQSARQAPVSDIPTEAPKPIGAAAAAEIILNSDLTGIPRDDLQKAAWHALGMPEALNDRGLFENDQFAIDTLAAFDAGQRDRLNRWMDKRRAKMAEEAKGATA